MIDDLDGPQFCDDYGYCICGNDCMAPPPQCSGECLTGWDLGLPSGGVAYPYPGCPAHDCHADPFTPDEEESLPLDRNPR